MLPKDEENRHEVERPDMAEYHSFMCVEEGYRATQPRKASCDRGLHRTRLTIGTAKLPCAFIANPIDPSVGSESRLLVTAHSAGDRLNG